MKPCLAIHVHVCLYKVWLDRLLHLSFLSTFLKLACYAHVYISMYRFGPSQLSCLGSSVGRALCLEYRVSWVRVPPEAAHFF